jgi:hypothetical protein
VTPRQKKALDFGRIREAVLYWAGQALDQRRTPRRERNHVDVGFAAANVVAGIVKENERVIDRFPLSSVEWGADVQRNVTLLWTDRLKGLSEFRHELVDDLTLDVWEILPPLTDLEAWSLIEPRHPELTFAELFRPDKPRVPGYLRSLAASSTDEFRQIVSTQITEVEER